MFAILLAMLVVPPGNGVQIDVPGNGDDLGVVLPAYPRPSKLNPAELPEFVTEAVITDVEPVYFDNDNLGDLAVAWFYDDPTNPNQRQRKLSLYRGLGSGLDKFADIDLYRPSTFPPPLDDAVFENGTGEVVVGDFDGDGDQDVAVLPYFSAEIWFIENRGGGSYQQYYKYIFGQFGGGFLTPPEGAAADFDGDGRDDLVYVVNPTPNASGQLHFWRTTSSIAAMQRVPWEGIEGGVAVTDTLGLAVGNFDGNGGPDVAFTARQQIVEEPAIVIWHGFEADTQTFEVQLLFPDHYSADIEAISRRACGDDLVIDDRDTGNFVEVWETLCTDDASYEEGDRIGGLGGTSPEFGLVIDAADLNDDGEQDLLVRQRIGLMDDAEQIKLLLWDPFMEEFYVDTDAISSESLDNRASNQLLRPRSLAAVDVMGTSAPEIIAGFSGDVVGGAPLSMTVQVWSNGCPADVDEDGTVFFSDLSLVLEEDADADINRDGNVDVSDLSILLANWGCSAMR